MKKFFALLVIVLGLFGAVPSASAGDYPKLAVDDYEAQIWENGVVVGTVNFSVSNSGNTLTLGGYTLTWDSTSCSYIAQIGGTLHQATFTTNGSAPGRFTKVTIDTVNQTVDTDEGTFHSS